MKNLFKSYFIICTAITCLLLGLFLYFFDHIIIEKWGLNQSVGHIIKELIVVFGAAFIAGIFFEFKIKDEISTDFVTIIELREKYRKAGIIDYIESFDATQLMTMFSKRPKKIDIYVNYGRAIFGLIDQSLKQFCEEKENELNIFILSDKNKFIEGLGALWGKENASNDQTGIKNNIDATVNSLKVLFDNLKKEGKLNAQVRVFGLLDNPVFYSFYRFDDEMLYCPSKIGKEKAFKPLAIHVKKTTEGSGIYNKCMQELVDIKKDEKSLEKIYSNE